MRYTPIDQETLAISRISPAKVQYDVKADALSADTDLYALMRRGRLERSAAFIGISGFLKKPFNAADIDTLMHEYLEIDKPKFGKVRDTFSFLSRERKAS